MYDNIFLRTNIVPTITPLTEDGGVDADSIPGYLDHLFSLGTKSILVMGLTGEFDRLDNATRLHAVRLFASENRNKFRLFVNATGDTEDQTISNVKIIEKYNIDGLVLAPLYYLDGCKDIMPHLNKLKIQKPLMIYNIPSLTNDRNITPEIVGNLYNRGVINAFKDDSGDIEMTKQYIKHAVTYQGDESKILPSIQAGARGAVGSTGNVSNIIEKIVLELHSSNQDLITKFRPTITANLTKVPEAIKYILWKKGVCKMHATGNQKLTRKERAQIDAVQIKLDEINGVALNGGKRPSG